MIDREYFTLVFKGDIGNFQLNPMNTETVFGRPEAAGRGNAFEECEDLREENERFRRALEVIAGAATDKLHAIQARAALDNIGAAVSTQKDPQ